MHNTDVISELRRKNDELQQELKNVNAELRVWYENGVLLTSDEKQAFYRMYREEQRRKRREAEEKARKELEKITTRVMTLKRGEKHAEDV